MVKLILFEFKKISSTIFFRILLLLFLLFFFVYYVFVYINTVRPEDSIEKLEDSIQLQEQGIADMKKSVDKEKENNIQTQIDFWEDWLKKDKETLQFYKEEDWKSILQQEIESEEATIDALISTNMTHTYTYPTLFTVQSYVDQSKWMIDREITPLFPIGSFYWMTLYDKEFLSDEMSSEEVRELYLEQSKKYSSTGLYYLYQFFDILFSVVGAVIFIFLIGDVVTKEGFGRSGSINLIRTQPIHRSKILLSKYISILLLSFLIVVSAVFLSILVGTIFDQFGEWEYPILIYGENRTFSFMKLGIFLIKAIAMFLFILLFCFSILFLFSVLTKRTLVTIGLTFSLLFIGIRWSEETVSSSLAHVIPFHYFSVYDVISNEFALTNDNFNFSYSNGMISLGLFSLSILLITYGIFIFQNRAIASRVGVRR